MKKHFLLTLTFIAVCTLFASAQNKIDKYCQVIVESRGGLSSKRVVHMSFGNYNSFKLKDTSAMQQLNYVNYLTSEPDVLNYMSKMGWELVNAHSGGLYTLMEIFYFKKSFDPAELAE